MSGFAPQRTEVKTLTDGKSYAAPARKRGRWPKDVRWLSSNCPYDKKLTRKLLACFNTMKKR